MLYDANILRWATEQLEMSRRAQEERARAYVAAWEQMDFDNEAIHMAYQKTILKTQSMNWDYMNAILSQWHESGLHTGAAIRAQERGSRDEGQQLTPAEEEFQQEMERMRRLIDQIEKGE